MSRVETELTAAPMTGADLDQVLAIERVSFVTPWTRAAFCYEIEQNKVARCTVMHASESVVGYVCLWEIGHEIHITNLAVHPEWRRRGVGKRLLTLAMAEGGARGVTLAFLEVRPSNAHALRLYESLGYVRWGTHPVYARVEGRIVPGHYYYKLLEDQAAGP